MNIWHYLMTWLFLLLQLINKIVFVVSFVGNNGTFIMGYRAMLMDVEFLYHLAYVLTSTLGLCVNELFYSILVYFNLISSLHMCASTHFLSLIVLSHKLEEWWYMLCLKMTLSLSLCSCLTLYTVRRPCLMSLRALHGMGALSCWLHFWPSSWSISSLLWVFCIWRMTSLWKSTIYQTWIQVICVIP